MDSELPTGHGQAFQQNRSGPDVAAIIDVAADGDDVSEHVFQIARDGDFFDRILYPAVFHPEAGGPARIIAVDHIDALPHQLGHQEACAHGLEHALKIERAGIDGQIMDPAGVAGADHPQFAGRIGVQDIAAKHPPADDVTGSGGDAFTVIGGAAQRAF